MCVCVFVFQAADEPAYLTVGTDVSAKYRGAFCEAKIKTVKRMVKVKVRAALTTLTCTQEVQGHNRDGINAEEQLLNQAEFTWK